ncbi:AKAP7 2'5' RNA ligase-like domain-containing protein [Dichotomocladium elegans]|nr:AKAP7 2'5' RNA ligase-like domain-containing protein [Dichotomocladium elegans]
MSKATKSLQGISLIRTKGRTYRVNTRSLQRLDVQDPVDNSGRSSSDDDEEGIGRQEDRGTIYTEEFITVYHPVHSKFHGTLIGRGGSTLKRLSRETGTRIDISKGRDTVMIKGTKEKVDRAIETIEDAIAKYKERARPTHFLSLPIQSAYTIRKLEEFHGSVLSSTFRCSGMDPSIVVSPANIHITLGVFKLLHQSDIEKTVRFLKTECPNIVQETMAGHRVLNIHLRGLKIMESDPAKAHVLYIEPKDEEEDGVLHRLATALSSKMKNAGLMLSDDRPLKLHVTLINTANRAKPTDSENNNKTPRISFDARPILKEYGQLDLGTVQLDKLHLMQMGRRGPGGTYRSEGSIPIGN